MISIDFSLISRATGSQSFIATSHQADHTLNHQVDQVLCDANASTVFVTRKDQHVLKLIRPRRWHEYFKLLWGHSRYQKEIKGNRLLRNIGLNTPEIYETAIGLMPSSRYQYLGYYVMENLNKRDFVTLFSYLETLSPDNSERQTLFDIVIDGLTRMKAESIVFTDFHLNNVMVNQKGEFIWIDTGVTHYPWYRKHLMRKKLQHSIQRLIQFHGEDFFTEQEKRVLESVAND